MKVNEPVIDNNYMVLIPTRINDKLIRDTDRMMKHGLLGIADTISLSKVITSKRLRENMVNLALDRIYGQPLKELISKDDACMTEF